MNIQQAASASYIHWGNCTRTIGPKGGVKEHSTVCKVNGSLKTWKTRPNDFRLPVKHGMRGYGEVTPENISQFHLESECPLHNDGTVANDVHNIRVQIVTVPILGNMEFYRTVCTCGFVSKEHQLKLQAEVDGGIHLAEHIL